MKLPYFILGTALALSAATGVLAATAFSGSQQEPTKTVTIDVGTATGATGATGPQGPKGDIGATGPKGEQGPKGIPGDPTSCRTGFTYSIVVINAPGGQTTFETCVKD